MPYIITFLFFVLLLLNYRRTVLLFVPFHLLLLMFVFPQTPFSCFDVVAALITALAPFHLFAEFRKFARSYPFYVGSFFMLLSVVGTNLFIEPHWPTATLSFNSFYIYPIIVWLCIKDKEDLSFVVHAVMFFTIVLGCYALFELVTSSNPVIKFFISSGLGNVSVLDYDKVRFGIKRCQSFLSTPAPTGMIFGLVLGTFYWFDRKYKICNDFPKLLLFALCFIGFLISGTRSVIAASFVALCGIIIKEFILSGNVLLKICVALIAFVFMAPFLLEILDSFINTDQTAVSGSTSSMRQEQFLISLFYWAKSPIWGNGSGFIWHYVQEVDKDIYGAESIWFQLLVDFGAVGAFAYFSCILNSIIVLCKRNFFWIFIPLAFLAGKTLSTVIGIEMSVLFLFSIILIKYDELFLKPEGVSNACGK